ncbi:YcaO-like family protein [Phytoactinopolyspora limicola]|uniref:YcaO-like family protein n=1 Tax=Phytoactinopolyspora limicola TaxID=2715536 RepID=UPI00140D81DF|nr:YcaO-like family protein [Phytoactinopolyspora limicola]
MTLYADDAVGGESSAAGADSGRGGGTVGGDTFAAGSVDAGAPRAASAIRLDVDVRPLGTGQSLLVTSSGRLFELDRPPAQLLDDLDELAASPDQPPWPELAAVLRQAGALAQAAPARGARAEPLLLADATLFEVVEQLAPHGELWPLADTGDGIAAAIRAAGERPLLVLRDRFDPGLFTAVDEQRAASGGRWAPFHLDRGRAWLGPAVEPGPGADYRDLLMRRRCAAQRADIAAALLEPPLNGPLRPPDRMTLSWLVALFLGEVGRWLTGDPSSLVGNEIELDPAEPAIRVHPVLPPPDRRVGDASDTSAASPDDSPDAHPGPANHVVSGPDLLRDERLGIVTSVRRITHHPSIPTQLATVQADVADMGRVYPWAPNVVCGGSVFNDPAAAEAAAIGESVERYCGNWVRPDQLRRASFAELTAAGEHALDPQRLVLYSPALYAQPGFPFEPFHADLQVHWVRGASFTTGRPTWVPASLVYVNWYVGPFADAPKTNYPIYAGLAGGASLDDAVRSGLEEIIERDATMIWWANREPLPVLEPPPRLSGLFDGAPTAHGQQAWLVALDNTFGVPVLAGVVDNGQDEILAIGFGARDTPEGAALKAWAEALTLQEIARDLQEPDGRFWQAVRDGRKRQGFMKPWRADRAYLDDFRSDFRDVGDLECQMQVHLDPRARATVRPWTLAGPRRPLESVPSLPDRSLATYRHLVERAGYEIIVVDLTTPDVAASGLRVVRVIVPGLVSNFPAAFPFTGHGRLQTAPVDLGWRDEPLDEAELTLFPLPHA